MPLRLCNCLRLPYLDGASFSGYRPKPWPVPGTNETVTFRGIKNFDAALDFAFAHGMAGATDLSVLCSLEYLTELRMPDNPGLHGSELASSAPATCLPRLRVLDVHGDVLTNYSPGTTIPAVASNVDWMATVLDITGAAKAWIGSMVAPEQ